MAGQNTAIGEGIAMGVRALKTSKAASKVIILLSDGEHNSGRISPKEATKLAVEQQIKIYTVGIGDDKVDGVLLQQVADESGGKYFFAQDADTLQSVYDEIDTLERSKIKSSEYMQKEYFYQYLLMGVFVLMLYLLYRKQIV
jgi:Ca-activated chloride channel family protein